MLCSYLMLDLSLRTVTELSICTHNFTVDQSPILLRTTMNLSLLDFTVQY